MNPIVRVYMYGLYKDSVLKVYWRWYDHSTYNCFLEIATHLGKIGIKVHAKMYGDFSGALPYNSATVLILCIVWDLTWPWVAFLCDPVTCRMGNFLKAGYEFGGFDRICFVGATVDGSDIRLTSWGWYFIPWFFWGLYIPGGLPDFFHQQY